MSITEELKNRLIPLYTNHYFSHLEDEDKLTKFSIIGGYVLRYILCSIYCQLVMGKEIEAVENIPHDKIIFYKQIANKFCHQKEDTHSIVVSAYIMELITSTF